MTIETTPPGRRSRCPQRVEPYRGQTDVLAGSLSPTDQIKKYRTFHLVSLQRWIPATNSCLIDTLWTNNMLCYVMSNQTRRDWLCLVGAAGIGGVAGCSSSEESSPSEEPTPTDEPESGTEPETRTESETGTESQTGTESEAKPDLPSKVTERWRFGGSFTELTVVDGTVYVGGGRGSNNGNVYALAADVPRTVDGAELWSFPTGADASPTVVDETVYVGGVNAV